jgi:hypothetical protein
MYAHHAILPVKNLHIQIDLPAEFANCQEAEIIVLPRIKSSVTKKHASGFKISQLNSFFAQLPKLGEDSAALAEDLTAIRQQIPLETNSWD